MKSQLKVLTKKTSGYLKTVAGIATFGFPEPFIESITNKGSLTRYNHDDGQNEDPKD